MEEERRDPLMDSSEYKFSNFAFWNRNFTPIYKHLLQQCRLFMILRQRWFSSVAPPPFPMAISLQIPRVPHRAAFISPSPLSAAGALPLRLRKPISLRCTADSPSSPGPLDPDFDAKLFWKNWARGENYNRKGFGHKEETMKLMNSEFTSEFSCIRLYQYRDGFKRFLCWMAQVKL